MFLKTKKQVNYVESDSEGEDDEEQIFRPGRKNNANRANKRRKPSPESDDDFEQAQDGGDSDDGELRTLHQRPDDTDKSRYGRFYSCR